MVFSILVNQKQVNIHWHILYRGHLRLFLHTENTCQYCSRDTFSRSSSRRSQGCSPCSRTSRWVEEVFRHPGLWLGLSSGQSTQCKTIHQLQAWIHFGKKDTQFLWSCKRDSYRQYHHKYLCSLQMVRPLRPSSTHLHRRGRCGRSRRSWGLRPIWI